MVEPVVIGNATLYHGDKRKRRGRDHPLYRGGKSHDASGYVTITSGPHAGKREHRVVMEKHLWRRLSEDEIVHHNNGDKADNRIENLSLETRATHNRKHGSGKELVCSKCGKKRWYQPALLARMNQNRPYRCRTCWAKTGGNAECLNKKK